MHFCDSKVYPQFYYHKVSSKRNKTACGKKCKKVHTLREKIGDVQIICSTQNILELLCLSNYGSLVGQNKNIKKRKKREGTNDLYGTKLS